MNTYKFSELYLGMEESFCVEVTQESMDKFREITGDVNLLHTNNEFANKRGYREKIVYGMLTTSYLSTLAGVYLPGMNSLIQSMKIKYSLPVYVGDMLRINGIVTELSESVNSFEMKVSIVNQCGEKVLSGKMIIGVLDEG